MPSPSATTLGSPQGGKALASIQLALSIAGFNPGRTDGKESDAARQAFVAFWRKKGYPPNDFGLRMTLYALAQEVLNSGPPDAGRLEIAKTIGALAAQPSSEGTTPRCQDGHWIASVMSDGQLVKLEDDSIWEIDEVDTVDTLLWLPTENVMICGSTMINTDNGDKVGAKRLK